MRTNTLRAAAACLSGCLLALGLLGCCAHKQCSRGPVIAEPDSAAAPPQPVPGALEYPRFFPVPTRPVFLPPGLEPPAAEVQPTPTEPPVLNAVPNDGWRPPAKQP